MNQRKPRQRQHQHQPGPTPLIHASDYHDESDAINYHSDTQLHMAASTTRTNTELNLAVINRYIPNVRSITSIAANAVVYSFHTDTSSWEKISVEGTLFVTSDYDHDIETGNEEFTLMVLNRRGLNNLIVKLGDLLNVEVTKDLLIVVMKNEEGSVETTKVMGIWIHEDQDGIRDQISGKIKNLWDKTKAVRESTEKGFKGKQLEGNFTPGRRLSLSEMFGRRPS